MLFALDSDLPVARCHFCLSLLCLPYLLSCQTQFAFIECKYLLNISQFNLQSVIQSVIHSFSQSIASVPFGRVRIWVRFSRLVCWRFCLVRNAIIWFFIIIICLTGNGKRKSGQRLTVSMALIHFLISLKHC